MLAGLAVLLAWVQLARQRRDRMRAQADHVSAWLGKPRDSRDGWVVPVHVKNSSATAVAVRHVLVSGYGNTDYGSPDLQLLQPGPLDPDEPTWTGRVARGNLTPGLPQNPCVTVSRYTALAVLVIRWPVSPRPSVRSSAAG